MMSSLYIGATGMKGHSEGMGVIGHNLANVNTLGYKQQSLEFADLVSQYVTASSANMTNINQKGSGLRPLDTRTLFVQGGYEVGSAATDLMINGLGFFGVTKNGQTHYTRAGDFRFTKDGELVDPNGWTVLGRAINGEIKPPDCGKRPEYESGHTVQSGVESSAITPIVLDMSDNGVNYMAPKQSTFVTTCSRLGGLQDKSSDPANPFFAMAANWDGAQTPPLGSNSYSYKESIEFYDAKGTLQTATVYYDAAGTSGGLTAVEYLVAMDPGRDGSGLGNTQGAGLLLAGTITFASNGDMTNLTAFSPPASGNPADLSGWLPASTMNGQPAFTVQITSGDPPTVSEPQTIALDMGYVYGGGGSTSGGLASAADAAATPGEIYRHDTTRTLNQHASSGAGTSPGGMYSSRDGYTEGQLRDVQVGTDGIIRGLYSNGQSEDLYRIVLYRFTSQDGLRNEGNNHFAATPEAGAVEVGIPGEENFGELHEYALEQSNVDYAREFSRMIVTQRGFQMNSKVITTSDTMLQRALELKR